jgi:hypothetical protein
MSALHVTNFIAAPSDIVFDLSRHILLQKKAMEMIGARLVRGLSSGLKSTDDTVMWSLSFFKNPVLFSLKLSECDINHHLKEEMKGGPLVSFTYDRYVKGIKNGTLVIDEIRYELPDKWWAKAMDKFIIKKKIQELLKARNIIMKEYAESNKWRALLTK